VATHGATGIYRQPLTNARIVEAVVASANPCGRRQVLLANGTHTVCDHLYIRLCPAGNLVCGGCDGNRIKEVAAHVHVEDDACCHSLGADGLADNGQLIPNVLKEQTHHTASGGSIQKPNQTKKASLRFVYIFQEVKHFF
jgi:hypothetical protein